MAVVKLPPICWAVISVMAEKCPERGRLWCQLSSALDEQSRVLGELTRVTGPDHRALLDEMKRRTEESQRKVKTALDDYEEHIREHGC